MVAAGGVRGERGNSIPFRQIARINGIGSPAGSGRKRPFAPGQIEPFEWPLLMRVDIRRMYTRVHIKLRPFSAQISEPLVRGLILHVENYGTARRQ